MSDRIKAQLFLGEYKIIQCFKLLLQWFTHTSGMGKDKNKMTGGQDLKISNAKYWWDVVTESLNYG